MANKLVIPRDAALWAVIESTRGTLVYPAAADAIAIAGEGESNQVPSYTDSEEIVNSRDVLAQFQDVTPAGEWRFSTYVRPSGSAGTAPEEGVLWKALLGKETVTPATSVVDVAGAHAAEFLPALPDRKRGPLRKRLHGRQTRPLVGREGRGPRRLVGQVYEVGMVRRERARRGDHLDACGTPVIALGNPHGLKHSVVSGVVSGTREVDGRRMIQLAIPIEPGNSGGPVVDLQGGCSASSP